MHAKISSAFRKLERGKMSNLIPIARRPLRRPALDISSQPSQIREAISVVRGVIQDGWDSRCGRCRQTLLTSADVKKDFLGMAGGPDGGHSFFEPHTSWLVNIYLS